MQRWSLTRIASPNRTVPARRRHHGRRVDPVRLLRSNPALLLAGPRTSGSIEALLRTWNPLPTRDEQDVLHVADGVRWHGPFPLDPTLAAEADLPGGWSTGYVAQAPRRRARIPDGRNSELLRRRYPHDIPIGPEASAWALVSGLARLLSGAARLPGCAPYAAEPEDTAFCVYGHEALPWAVLRTVLAPSLPDLARNGALAGNDYCLDRADQVEIRVRPFSDTEFLPYALRSRADEGWPHTVYRFRCVSQANRAATLALVHRVRANAVMLADIVGGVLLDSDGFPVPDVGGTVGDAAYLRGST